MSARPWRVESRHPSDRYWDPEVASFTSRETAETRAKLVLDWHPLWAVRLRNVDTGEVVHV